MPLVQRGEPHFRHTTKPQPKFLTQLWGPMRMLPAHVTFRQRRRDRAYPDRTCARWYAREVDLVALHKAALTAVVPSAPEPAGVMDASGVPNSGKKTSGRARFWNGRQRRTETGLESSARAWLDIPGNGADGLSVAQTPPTREAINPEATRLAGYREPWPRVVSAHALGGLPSVVTDGDDRTQTFIAGVRS